ncbi:hypothetical protein Tco_1563249 [Tanacetum coccineum]
MGQLAKALNERPQGVLPSNTIPNPREDIKVVTTQSGITLAGPSVLPPPPSSSSKGVERDPKTTMDQSFTFPADFIIVDYDVDPRVSLILRRLFLRTARALVDVYGEELALRVGDEKLIFNVERTSKYPHKHGDESINQIDIIDTTCEDHFHEVLNVQKSIHSLSGSPTPSSDLADSISPEIDEGIFGPKGDIILFEKLLNNDSTKDLPLKELKNDEIKTTESSIEEPPDLELKDLPPHLEYAFLEGTSKLP